MPVVEADITVVTQSMDTEGYARLVAGGQVIRAQGIINCRWDEYSARTLAEQVSLSDVEWDAVEDHTAGTLCLRVRYGNLAPSDVIARLVSIPNVEDWDIAVTMESGGGNATETR